MGKSEECISIYKELPASKRQTLEQEFWTLYRMHRMRLGIVSVLTGRDVPDFTATLIQSISDDMKVKNDLASEQFLGLAFYLSGSEKMQQVQVELGKWKFEPLGPFQVMRDEDNIYGLIVKETANGQFEETQTILKMAVAKDTDIPIEAFAQAINGGEFEMCLISKVKDSSFHLMFFNEPVSVKKTKQQSLSDKPVQVDEPIQEKKPWWKFW